MLPGTPQQHPDGGFRKAGFQRNFLCFHSVMIFQPQNILFPLRQGLDGLQDTVDFFLQQNFLLQRTGICIFLLFVIGQIAVLFPLLTAVEPDDEYYDEVRSIVKVLNYVLEADVDDEIPPTSLVREFIGGNSFYR